MEAKKAMADEKTYEKDTYKKPDPKKRLGRGLNALFEDDKEPFGGGDDATATAQGGDQQSRAATGKAVQTLGLDQLEPGAFQPRRHMDQDHIKELAESIAVHGILQPIIVRPKAGFDKQYEIIAGERRWRAAQYAQLHEVPVLVRSLSDIEALEFGLIENLQREDLNALEEALGYRQLIDEFGHTQEKVAAALGKSRSHIANMMRLLLLPVSVQDMVRDHQLSAGHARALITAEQPEKLAKLVVKDNLSVRETERLVSGQSGKSKNAGKSSGKPSSHYEKDVDTIALEKELTDKIGMKVTIDMKPSGTGAGAIKIDFKNLDQLDDILGRL